MARGLRDLEALAEGRETEAAAAESITAHNAASSRSLSSIEKGIGDVIRDRETVRLVRSEDKGPKAASGLGVFFN